MKIAVSGTQCTGKTSTINLIKQSFINNNKSEDFPILDHHKFSGSKTHEILDLGLKLNDSADDISQTIMLSNYLKDTIELNLISDRCILDNCVYTAHQYQIGKCSESLFKLTTELYYKLVSKYDYIFYFPPEINIISNGIRSVDHSYRNEIHLKFLDFMDERDNIHIIPGTPTEKYKTIKRILNYDIKQIRK